MNISSYDMLRAAEAGDRATGKVRRPAVPRQRRRTTVAERLRRVNDRLDN